MAEFPALQLWTDAYLGDTTHLTTLEHGAYLLLLIAMWRTKEKRLINNDERLARYAKLTNAQWARIRPTIMEFFRCEGDWLTQGRLTDEANLVRRNSRKQSDRAKLRWRKEKTNGHANAMPEGCRIDAPTPTPTPISSKDDIPPSFWEFWKVYPRKKARADAIKAYRAAVKLAEPEAIISALKEFPFSKEAQFQPYPASWLRDQRWLDEKSHDAGGYLPLAPGGG